MKKETEKLYEFNTSLKCVEEPFSAEETMSLLNYLQFYKGYDIEWERPTKKQTIYFRIYFTEQELKEFGIIADDNTSFFIWLEKERDKYLTKRVQYILQELKVQK